MITLGLIRENKQPPDRRVAFTPHHCLSILENFKDCRLQVEASADRVFSNANYLENGISIVSNLEEADILFGIKEVPVQDLIEGKTYLFFSHTIKKQVYNQALLKAMVEKKIRFIDYECLVWPNGSRVLGFGRYAGIVGAYETLRAAGRKYATYSIKPAYECKNYREMIEVLLGLGPIIKNSVHKIVITGSGRVSHGAEELLLAIGFKKVSPWDFLNTAYVESTYTLLDTYDLYERLDGEVWDHEHFFQNHSAYKSKFDPYTTVANMVINGVFWGKDMPQHFSKEDTKAIKFSIKIIGDISCDIEGSIPITLKDTHMNNPVFGWDAQRQCECEPYTENSIDVMAVSNLPSALPADASEGFGDELIKTVLPELLHPQTDMIKNATLCENGQLTYKFQYLSDYISSS